MKMIYPYVVDVMRISRRQIRELIMEQLALAIASETDSFPDFDTRLSEDEIDQIIDIVFSILMLDERDRKGKLIGWFESKLRDSLTRRASHDAKGMVGLYQNLLELQLKVYLGGPKRKEKLVKFFNDAGLDLKDVLGL